LPIPAEGPHEMTNFGNTAHCPYTLPDVPQLLTELGSCSALNLSGVFTSWGSPNLLQPSRDQQSRSEGKDLVCAANQAGRHPANWGERLLMRGTKPKTEENSGRWFPILPEPNIGYGTRHRQSDTPSHRAFTHDRQTDWVFQESRSRDQSFYMRFHSRQEGHVARVRRKLDGGSVPLGDVKSAQFRWLWNNKFSSILSMPPCASARP